jgi:hypothetical protein
VWRGMESAEPYVTELWSVLSVHELLAILRQPRAGPVRVTAARVESYSVLGLRPNLVLAMAVVL